MDPEGKKRDNRVQPVSMLYAKDTERKKHPI